MSHPRRAAVAALALLTLLPLGCSRHARRIAPVASPTPTVSASPTLSVAPGAWLTGIAGYTGPVVVLKVDNAPSARPLQLGLDKASIVYQEVVEGGATRFAAVFPGPMPVDVGPIRSARDTDIELLAQYGRVVFGFSGANRNVLAHVDAANLVDASWEHYDALYDVRGARAEAYNVYTSPARLVAQVGHGAAAVRDIGLRFGAAPVGGRPATGSVQATFTPDAQDELTWDATRKAWRIAQNGRPVTMANGAVIAPANVIVQFVPLTRGGYVDVLGNNSPDSRTVGRGRAVVLREGKAYDATWVRPQPTNGTRFVDAAGDDVVLHPGRTWVLLVPDVTKLVYG